MKIYIAGKIVTKRALLIRFRQWLCRHPKDQRVEIYRDYQEGYVQEICKQCEKHIYSDL